MFCFVLFCYNNQQCSGLIAGFALMAPFGGNLLGCLKLNIDWLWKISVLLYYISGFIFKFFLDSKVKLFRKIYFCHKDRVLELSKCVLQYKFSIFNCIVILEFHYCFHLISFKYLFSFLDASFYSKRYTVYIYTYVHFKIFLENGTQHE